MAVTIVNLEAIPDDLAPGPYCCRLDESSAPGGIRARFVLPPRRREPGDCLIHIVKHGESSEED